MATLKTRPRARGIVCARADASDLTSVLSKIDGLTAKIDENNKNAVKPEALVALNQTIAEQKTKIDAQAKILDDVSKELAALKLNGGLAYGEGARAYKRHKTLKAFTGKDADTRAYRAGMWLAAAVFGHSAAAQWCTEHDLGIVKDTSTDKTAIAGRSEGFGKGGSVFAAASENTNTAGGFLVPAEMENTIIDLREQYGTMRRMARIYSMASDTKWIPRRASGLTAYFPGENTAATESQKGWDQVQLVAKKAMVLTRYSNELDEDAIINMADDLTQEIAYAFAVLEDSCGWNGDGSPTYGGIQGIRGKIIGLKGGTVAASNHDTFAEFDLTDLEAVMSLLPLYAWRTANWIMSLPAYNLIVNRLGYAASGNTVETIARGPSGKYALGFPVEFDQTLPTAGGSTDYSNQAVAFFGDMSLAVAFGNRRGMTIRQSDQRYLEYDQIGIVGTERFDIVAHGLGTSTVAGPLVALVGE